MSFDAVAVIVWLAVVALFCVGVWYIMRHNRECGSYWDDY